MNDFCRLCKNLTSNGYGKLKSNPWDTILFESENFIIVPTVGALVEGWVLVVPKKHYLCMGALNQNTFKELNSICDTAFQALTDIYGPVTILEHGPSRTNQLVGCGVDHAHLHLVPGQYNLMNSVKKIFSEILEWQSVEGLEDSTKYYNNGMPYLYFNEPNDKGFLATHSHIPSQVFRKAISLNLGIPDHFNWRSFPKKENVLATVKAILEWKKNNNKISSELLEVING